MAALFMLAPSLLSTAESGVIVHNLGSRGDSLVLAILGVTFLLFSVLAHGFSHDEARDGEADAGAQPDPQLHRIEIKSVDDSKQRVQSRSRGPLLSVDLEDYFQTETMSSIVSRDDWNFYSLRVVENTRRLLDLFDEYNAKATFFVLGWIADRVPFLLREIAGRGHELACHSYWHRLVYTLTESEFRIDTMRAITAIEDAAGLPVEGYRAPTWSITRKSIWALQALMEAGLTYDSSVYPVRRDLYGIPGASATPHIWTAGANTLLEIPPATASIGEWRFPAAGGGYLRMFPAAISRLAIEQLMGNSGVPVVYLHPWEIDPDQPRFNASFKSRVRQYVGLHTVEGKLRYLLSRYRFVAFRDCVDLATAAPQLPISFAGMAVPS